MHEDNSKDNTEKGEFKPRPYKFTREDQVKAGKAKTQAKKLAAQLRGLKLIKCPEKKVARIMALAQNEMLSRQNLILLQEEVKDSNLTKKEKMELLKIMAKNHEVMFKNIPNTAIQLNVNQQKPFDVAGYSLRMFRLCKKYQKKTNLETKWNLSLQGEEGSNVEVTQANGTKIVISNEKFVDLAAREGLYMDEPEREELQGNVQGNDLASQMLDKFCDAWEAGHNKDVTNGILEGDSEVVKRINERKKEREQDLIKENQKNMTPEDF